MYVNVCWQHAFVFLCRIDLGKPDEPNQVELGRKDEARVYKMFLDHTGEAVGSWVFTDSGQSRTSAGEGVLSCFVRKENRSIFHEPDSVSQGSCPLVCPFAISKVWVCYASVVFSLN